MAMNTALVCLKKHIESGQMAPLMKHIGVVEGLLAEQHGAERESATKKAFALLWNFANAIGKMNGGGGGMPVLLLRVRALSILGQVCVEECLQYVVDVLVPTLEGSGVEGGKAYALNDELWKRLPAEYVFASLCLCVFVSLCLCVFVSCASVSLFCLFVSLLLQIF